MMVMKRNMTSWLIYTVVAAIILYLSFGWCSLLFLSLLIGFLFGFLNTIVTELRKLNGEEFDSIEE